MNSTPAFFNTTVIAAHRIGNPNPGIGLRALDGWNREAGRTSDLGLRKTEHDAGQRAIELGSALHADLATVG